MSWSGWVMCKQKKSDGASLQDEMACLDCLITKNRPEQRSQGLVELSTISNGSTHLPFSPQYDACEASHATSPFLRLRSLARTR